MMDKPTILIVDDQPDNIKIIASVLNERYTTMAATNGRRAIEIATSTNKPDLILLDIMMPGMDGFEVCRQLKAEKKTCDIPVIFVTAVDGINSEEKGFCLGAVDYIAKPIQPASILARVRTHLQVKRKFDHLVQSIENKTAGIFKNDQSTHPYAENRVPEGPVLPHTNMIHGNPHLMAYIFRNICNYLSMPVEESNIECFNKGGVSSTESDNNVVRIQSIIEYTRKFAHIHTDQKNRIRILDCITNAIRFFQRHSPGKIVIETHFSENLPVLLGNEGLLEHVFINIFENAKDAMRDVESKIIVLTAETAASKVEIRIEDTGPGLPRDLGATIWQPFITTKIPKYGTGLGLSISKSIVEAHGGSIMAENCAPNGARFTVRLPIDQACVEALPPQTNVA